MNNKEFTSIVKKANTRSEKLLTTKRKEYSDGDTNRLIQFNMAAGAQDTNPAEALIGMATKHFTSIAMMAKNPLDWTKEMWNEKLDNLRNYTYLLEAVVEDLDEE